jgi:hypothetical protein
MIFGFHYATTDGAVYGSHLEAPDWETALNAVQDLQGWQCGAIGCIISADGEITHDYGDPAPCPPHLRNHPAARMER